MGGDVGETLVQITERSQHTINGFANWDKEYGEFYIEEIGIVAAGLQEALVQDYDGIIRIAPAIPPGWSFEGSVFVRGKTKVDVQVSDGAITTAVIEAGTTATLKVRNPWPRQAVDVIAGATGKKVIRNSSEADLIFPAVAGTKYLLQPSSAGERPFAAISGTPVTSIKTLGRVQIGLPVANR